MALARIALGCANFGGIGSAPQFFGQGQDEEQAFTLMDAAWEAGITHFDTADGYGGGRSETAIGRWIAARGVRPTITSKTFHPLFDGDDRGLAPARIARSFEESLGRLGVDRLELYLAHEPDPDVPLDVAMGAFEALRAADRIDAYGLSNVNVKDLQLAQQGGTPTAVQNGYSLLQREDDDGLIDSCVEQDVAYTVYSPLRGGWLTGKYRRGSEYPAGSRMTLRPEPYADLGTEETFVALDALASRAQARGISMAGVAIAWLLSDPRIAQVVIGPNRPDQLLPVTEALAHPLTETERDELTGAFA
jgi:aryl-alcohol dehydrogenase-like predicted oxidoreductase